MKNTLQLIVIMMILAVASFATVTVSSPAAGASTGSPVHFVASATMSGTVTAMQVYVDGSLKYNVSGNKIDTYVSMSTGSRYVTVKSWNTYGQSEVKSMTINVTNSSGVNITSPSSGSTSGSPVHFVASAAMSGTVTAMQVYVDGALKYEVSGSKLDTYVSMAAGTRYVTVKSWNTYGQSAQQSMNINVGTSSGSGSSTTIPAGASTYSNVDQMSGWQSCDKCAGPGGDGPSTPYSMTQYQSSPSMDGQSTKFWLGGSTPYSQALWWKQLGANDSVKNFVYDLYFYYTDSAAPQALEFDLNQSVNGKKYIFGTQCSPRGSGQWDIWDNINVKWVSTGIACPAPPTYTWNHLTLEFKRTDDDKLMFVAITLNGKKSYLNRYYAPRTVNARELNVAFQMDGNYQQKNYSVWLDKVTLNAW